ncbi:MAG: hypothetical protein ABEJ92_01990 [Halobacteriales archaeon]
MENTEDLLDRSGFGATHRTDNWWSHPLAILVGLSLFVAYSLFRVLYPLFVPEAPGIEHGALLSPFFSPLLFSVDPASHHALFGAFPDGWPRWLRSPAVLVLWAPLGLRLTCYYARRAYYRGFFRDPPACAVGESRDDYRGETGLLSFQNVHRYFLYVALVFIVLLAYDTVRAMFWHAPAGAPFWQGSFEIHFGTLVIAFDTFLVAGYTLGCHSLRYLVGGNKRCFSCEQNPATDGGRSVSSRYRLWRGVTRLNRNHGSWFWFSLLMVAFADFYVWMVAIGVWPDVTLIAL